MTAFVFISALVATYVCHVKGQSSCSTPSGAGGNCVSLYDCPSLLAIVNNQRKTPQDIQLLKRSQCGYQGDIPKVCCPNEGCTTPDGQQGSCVGIYSCGYLAELLKPPVSKETVGFVQNSRCNGPEQYSVCCGQSAPTNLGGTRPPPVQNGVCTPTATLPDPRSGKVCCGVESAASDKIVGGEATAVDQYPWLALIEYLKDNRIKLLCGGALISGRYVLTAGHCVKGAVLNAGTPRNVRLGEYDTNKNGEDCIEIAGGGQDCTEGITIIPIEQIIAHPDYVPGHSLRRHDIALLRLSQLAPYTDFIRPICLPVNDITMNPPVNFTMYAAGWGAVSDDVSKSNIKLHVGLPFQSQQQCQPEYQKPRRTVPLWQGQLCAGGEKGKDSCKGDSGGPLMYENGRIYEVIGIVSFGPTPCGMENVPGVYTKVWEYKSWIQGEIRN